MNVIYYDYEIGYFQPDERNSVTYSRPSQRPGCDICHSISFYTIVWGLINPVNNFLYSPINEDYEDVDIENCIEYIKGMIASVYAIEEVNIDCIGQEGFFYFNELEEIKNELCIIISNEADEEEKKNQKECLEYNLSALAISLSTAPVNLRPGSSKWNRSLKNAFDPIILDVNEQNGEFIINHYVDCIRLFNLLNYTFLNKETDIEDIKDKQLTCDLLFFYTCSTKEGENYIYSSSWPDKLFEGVEAVEKCDNTIYYINPITNTKDPIETENS